MPRDLIGFGPSHWPTLEQAVAQIRARNPALAALRLDLSEQALRIERDSATLPDQKGALALAPYSLKDVWDTAAGTTTAGCHQYRERRADADCAVVRALSRSGAICVGKSNVPDLAATPECANSIFGVTTNPHDASRTAGGSSGGAAAAVASGMAAFDWGSDFGGSIRLPAAFCGIAGLRLSSRAWPISGHFPFIPPELGLQGQGPLARSVAGLRRVRDALAPWLRSAPSSSFVLQGVVVLRVDAFSSGEWPYADSEISDALGNAYVRRESAELPTPRDTHHAFAALLANNWRRLFGKHVRASALGAIAARGSGRMHPHTRRIIAELALANVSAYRNEDRTRVAVADVRRLCDAAFARGLLIASPTTTHPAPELDGAHAIRELGAFVKLANLLDATALAVPFGRFASGLPRSLQLIGPAAAEDVVLDLGEKLSRAN